MFDSHIALVQVMLPVLAVRRMQVAGFHRAAVQALPSCLPLRSLACAVLLYLCLENPEMTSPINFAYRATVQVSNGLTSKADGKDKLLATVQVTIYIGTVITHQGTTSNLLSPSLMFAVCADVSCGWERRHSEGFASEGRSGTEGFPHHEGAVSNCV
jgi:hypothetical protein